MYLSYKGLSDASTSTQLPNGKYAFEIDAQNADYESPNKGTKGIEVKMHIIEGMDFDDGTSTVGLQRTIRLWYPNKDQKDGGKFCLGRLNEFATACGLDTSSNGFDTEDLVGRRFVCRCKIKTDDKGQDSEEFDNFKAY